MIDMRVLSTTTHLPDSRLSYIYILYNLLLKASYIYILYNLLLKAVRGFWNF